MSSNEEELVSLGTVRDLVGKDGQIYPSNSNNLRNLSKRLLITLEDKAGTKETVLTSPEVNRRLRSKEIQLAEILDYPVYLTQVTDENGTVTEQARIGVNQGAEVKVMAVKATAPAIKETKATLEDYQSYLRY